MFPSAKKNVTVSSKKSGSPRDANAVTILTSGCHFSGKLYCRGASRIGGKIEGQIISEGLLIIEEDAHIDAEIKAEEAIIQGQVNGKIQASGRVELTASSQFEGDLITPVLVVREGARFNGHASMSRRDEAPAYVAPARGAKDASAATVPAIKIGKAVAAEAVRGSELNREVRAKDGAGTKTPELHVPTR